MVSKDLPVLPPTKYSSQPFKTIYIIYTFTSLIILLPFWIFIHFSPLNKFPSKWTLSETLRIRAMSKLTCFLSACDLPLGMRSIDKLPSRGSLKQSRAFFIEPVESKYVKGILKSEYVESVKIPAYLYGRDFKGEGGLKLEKDEKVGLYFHGGGLAVNSAHEDDITACIPKEIVKRSFKVKQVLSVEYRLVHQSCFPAQIIDALSAYMYLIITLQIPSRNILLIGDSAGGSLTLSLCRYLRDEGFDLPRGTLLMSPWSDMTNDVLPKCSFYKPLNKNIDYLNSSALQPWITNRLLLNNPISIIDSPYLSPASLIVPATRELFSGFPSALITSGGSESLIEQIRELVKRFEISGVDFVYDEQEHAVHDYAILDWFQPEMRERFWIKSTQWIDSLFP